MMTSQFMIKTLKHVVTGIQTYEFWEYSHNLWSLRATFPSRESAVQRMNILIQDRKPTFRVIKQETFNKEGLKD